MRIFWRFTFSLVVVFIIAATMLMISYENPDSVSAESYSYEEVSLAQRDVVINGILFQDQNHALYPMLERDGTAYVPLTFHMANLLNMHLWIENGELHLEKRVWDAAKPFAHDESGPQNEKAPEVKVLEGWLYIDGALVQISEPLLVFRDIFYLPVSDDVAEFMSWDVSRDERAGISVNCDNYFYLEDAMTVYQQGGMRIEMQAVKNRQAFTSHTLSIVKDAQEIPVVWPEGYKHFPYDNPAKPMFTVADGFIYTTCWDGTPPSTMEFCRVAIATGQCEIID